MSRANCCCGLNSSARPGAANESAASAVDTRARQRADRDIGHSGGLGSVNFWLHARPLASRQAQLFLQAPTTYFAFFTAMTSISTRNPGLASAATPTTERAGRLGWLPPKNWV